MIPLRIKALILISVTAILAQVDVIPVVRAQSGQAHQEFPTVPSKPAAIPIGTITDISGNVITLATGSGSELKVLVQGSTRILRTVPGQKDLAGAMPMELKDLQTGDRLLIRGAVLEDKSIAASVIVAMKQADIEERQQREQEDWQRGVGGLVSSVDPGRGIVMISTIAAGGKKELAIRVSKATIVRRYAPDSVRFDKAIPATLDQVQPGDQLRVRGTRSSDESEIAADEIVSGSFRNIAGTLNSVFAIKKLDDRAYIAPTHQLVHFWQSACFKERRNLSPLLHTLRTKQKASDLALSREKR